MVTKEKWLYDGLYRTRGESEIQVKNGVGVLQNYEYAYDKQGNVTHQQKVGEEIVPINFKEHPMDLMERLDAGFSFEKRKGVGV